MGSHSAKISNKFGILGVFGGIWIICDGVFGILEGVFADQQGSIYKRGKGWLIMGSPSAKMIGRGGVI